MRVVIVVVIVIVIVVTGGKQSQLLAFALGLGWSLTINLSDTGPRDMGAWFIFLIVCYYLKYEI